MLTGLPISSSFLSYFLKVDLTSVCFKPVGKKDFCKVIVIELYYLRLMRLAYPQPGILFRIKFICFI